MRIRRSLVWIALIALALIVPRTAAAEEAPRCAIISRANLVACALAASRAVLRERGELEVRDARVTTASPLLPSNPTLSGSMARRGASAPGTEAALNWTLTLSQELELAGQRGARMRAAESDALAQRFRIVTSEREAAAIAWLAYFDAVAAREEVRLAEDLEKAARAMATAARARADKGVGAEVEADAVEATSLRTEQARTAAAGRVRSADAVLALVTGNRAIAPPQVSNADLTPLTGIDTDVRAALARATEGRAELLALDAEERAFTAQASLYRRARVPNPTLSLFAQNDGYNERVFGIGLALPIPLPGLGRTYRGEIAEAEALARRQTLQRATAVQEISLDVVRALSDVDTKKAELGLFAPARIERARKALVSLGQEVEAGRMPVRDALVTQDRLIDLLRAQLEARRALCVASVALARAVGFPLERGEK